MDWLNKDYFFNNLVKNNHSKNRIILVNTKYPINDYLKLIKLRYNGKYNKLPNFTIDKNGFIYQHLNTKTVSKFFDSEDENKNSIIVALENVGLLNYNEQTNFYLDFRGNKHNGEVHEKIWRGKIHWDTYTESQFGSLLQLLDYLFNEHPNIKRRFTGNNVINNNPKYYGVLNKSNLNKNCYELTPAFNFDGLSKYINEQYGDSK